MTTLENFGVQTEAYVDQSGQVVVNFITTRALQVRVNGQVVSGGANKAAPKSQFWTPDGRQTSDGTVDLRGEVRG